MSSELSHVVRLDKVEKWFGPTVALQGIQLQVHCGEFVVLLGRNGAGKSTLLRIIARLVKPNAGQVEVCGLSLNQETEQVRHRLGFVGHQSFLYRNLTARENLRFFSKLYGLEDAEIKIQAALDQVDLQASADREVKGFSRGMQQRLAIARATLHQPELLLLDEPFTGLDWEASEILSHWLEQFILNRGTILMVTHDLEHGLGHVSRWVFLDRGKVRREMKGNVQSIRDEYRNFLKEGYREIS
jgi:heme exporter protein A